MCVIGNKLQLEMTFLMPSSQINLLDRMRKMLGNTSLKIKNVVWIVGQAVDKNIITNDEQERYYGTIKIFRLVVTKELWQSVK